MKFTIPQDKEKHFYNRAGFGIPSIGASTQNLPDLQNNFWRASKKINTLSIVEKPQFEKKVMNATKERRQGFLMKSRQDMIRLNLAWMDELRTTSTVLREKMTLFWHDHFACRTLVPYLAQQQNNTVRIFSLGKFEELLMAVSKDPAMLAFLNNQQNKKGSPNENFAREVMELFTLGRGNYTEADVKEGARAFTGWGFNSEAEFQFRPRQHDDGVKTFRGKIGNFTGEDILQMILEDPKTARFITEKLFRYWVSQEKTDPGIIKALTDAFFRSGYDLEKLVSSMFASDWFYEKRFVGSRIKSPVELLLSIQNHTGGEFQNPPNLIFIQRALGQLLFFPPNVGGWPQGKEWIDSSSLTFRMSLPHLLLDRKESDFEAKDDGDVNSPNASSEKEIYP